MAEMTKSGTCEGSKMGRIGYRPYWVLNFSILVRAIHQVGAAVVLAAFLLDDIGRPPSLYLAIACLSGGLLFFTEWMRHRQIYRELSGITTLIKLFLLGGVYHALLPGTSTVVFAFILASIGAHAPKLIRHRLLY